jgi:lauroyl/myristoyl acyltransferase
VLTYWAYRLASLLAPVLPRRVGYALCDLFGELAYRLGASARCAVRANLSHVFRSRPPNSAIREAFRSQARSYLDTFVIPSLTPTALSRWATVDGLEYLDAALARGRGVILVGVHVGSPSLAAQVLAERGLKLSVVVEPIQPPALFELINRRRSARGLSMVPLNKPAITRHLIRELRANHAIGLMLDRELTGNGELIPFFDAPAMLSTGPATLALMTGAALCPSLSLRRPDGLVHGIIEPAIDFAASGDRQADALALTRRAVERLEYYIEQAPGQWTLFVPVWNRPPGVSAVLRHTTT